MAEMNKIIARWQDWTGTGIEHLVLKHEPNRIVAEAATVGIIDSAAFAVWYQILCDASWRARKVEIAEIGSDSRAQLTSDGNGNWLDQSATPMPQLSGAVDIDISITPFTNTLPIRRLKLQVGQSAEILAVYVRVPGLSISIDRQRYTCLEAGRRYRYESLDSDFTREIEVDGHGLVVTYPGLFRRVL
jgi:uncharacterized protein